MALFSLLLSPDIRKKIARTEAGVFLGSALVCVAIYVVCLTGKIDSAFSDKHTVPMIANVAILSACALTLINVRMALVAGVLLMSAFHLVQPYDIVFTARNFYGVIRVQDRPAYDEVKTAVRQISHGTTIHGMQALDKKLSLTALSYYGPGSGFYEAFTSRNPKKVAIIGLGAGVQNCIASPQREFTFIDIDPGMVEAAQNHFTFLSECKNKKPPEIIVGDGRLEIEKMGERKFDVIVLDAFSGDAVPTHLLTVEALNSYFNQLEKNGLLILHVSNRYFDLGPVITRTAGEIGAAVAAKIFVPKKVTTLEAASYWIVLSKDEKVMNRFVSKGGWAIPTVVANTPIWTDDHNSLITTLVELNKGSRKKLTSQGK
jgi:spermidine synthase